MESFLRLVFFYLGSYGGAQLISPLSPAFVMQFVNIFSLALRLSGLLVIPGLLLFRIWGTIALCILTIGFDGWAVATIAWSAGVGLAIPILLFAYLVANEPKFVHRTI
jgi:hypothetical protein